MSMIKVVGIDIAKSVFQVCVWMVDGSVAWNKKISRSKLLDTIRQFEPGTLVAMEACATSHFWGRTISSMGYCVRLIPAQHVKAFVRSQKNDANDALAICETALRPGIHFVAVKTTEQQDIKALRNTRQLMVEQRTALANQLRSLLAEYGVSLSAGILHLQQQLPEVIEDASNELTFTLRRLLYSLREDMQALNERVTGLDKEITALSSQQTAYHHLLTIPGVGPLIAAAFISEVDAGQFSSGRELSAWCGLVPRQHSSGGKQRLSSVTKNGNRSLRTLIIHGARSVMRCVKKRDDCMGLWLQRLEARREFLKTTVALANKLTRIIWRVLTDQVDFNMSKAFSMI
ncbi:IS110 family transposase [Salmonella enterica subsp. salamae]|uniref:IS110 family transposase n=1 Tax=Salmonella enterica subsp. salamae TaxID=59202 RepID=A0A5Y3V1L3_SALER|nr:IS110 family transposase [Salmonella enterica subsp. salamae]ECI3453684.1 IS110 family transposase [Salmonella enterica subsp. salamae]ECJ2327650.1 IS110 family transposase [Salmonella enterica subsp. salamae]EEO8345038.1 IS110 family transposase [Salmonella enterica]